MTADHEERTRGLLRLAMLQTESSAAFRQVVEATCGGRSSDLSASYHEYFTRARALLAEAAPYERRWPGVFPFTTEVQQLTDQLLIASDHRENDGAHEAARALREEAVELAARWLGPAQQAAVSRWLASRAAAEGRFHEAIPALQDAVAALTADHRLDDAARACLDLANVWEWLGDYRRADEVLDQVDSQLAHEVAQDPPSTHDVLTALRRQAASIVTGEATTEGVHTLTVQHLYYLVRMARARVNRLRGRVEEAVRLTEECRPFARELGVEAALLFHLAAIDLDRARFTDAAETIQAIAPVFERPDFRPRRASLRVLQADLALCQGRPEEAYDLVQDGLADQSAHPDLDQEWRLRWKKARAELGRDRPGPALVSYRRAAAAVDALRKAPLGYELDSTYLEGKLPMFVEAIEEAVRQGDGPTAVTLIEQVKSRTLATVVSLPPSTEATAGPDEEEFNDVCRRIDAMAFTMTSEPGERAALARTALLARRDALMERLRIRDPRWRTVSVPAPLDAEHLPSYLRDSAAEGAPRRALVSLYRLWGRVVAAVIDETGIAVAAQDLPRAVEDAVSSYVDNVRRGLDPSRYDLDVTFTDLVPPSLAERALQADVVVVAPHDQWHLLPWASLPCGALPGSTSGSTPVFERVALGLLPSLNCLRPLDVTPLPAPGAALIGDPTYRRLRGYSRLTAAGQEIATIADLYGHRATSPVTGAEATEGAFWGLCASPGADRRILHVASHAVLDIIAPLASGLALDDGIVDAAEVMLRRCPFPEVVLSACSLGWRPQTVGDLVLHGDDALGLPAAFLEAGAKFLLASVPKADDAGIAPFMISWHRHRAAGDAPLAAYRGAQRELGAQPDSAWAWRGVTAYGCR